MENQINFHNSKGARLSAILDNPSDKKDAAIFILCHGHGSTKNSKTFLSLKEKVSPQGISTFRFDFYGHGESEGKFEDINATQAVDDISCSVNFLKNEGYSKIGLVGSSLGAFASVIVAARNPEIFALALKSPTLDFKIWKTKMIEKFSQNWDQDHAIAFETSSVKSNLNEAQLDAFVTDAERFNLFTIAQNIKIPMLVVHGEQDQTVPLETSRKIVGLIPSCKLVVIEGADHEYTIGNTFDQMIEVLAQFLITQK